MRGLSRIRGALTVAAVLVIAVVLYVAGAALTLAAERRGVTGRRPWAFAARLMMCVAVMSSLVGTLAIAADDDDTFDVLARELLLGFNTTIPIHLSDIVGRLPRVAIWPYVDRACASPSLASKFNDQLRSALLQQGSDRYIFVDQTNLTAVIKHLVETGQGGSDPVDGVAGLLDDTALLRANLFATLASFSPKSVTVFVDTCYSGIGRGGETLIASARGIAINPRASPIPANFTVFSAASGAQISSGLDETEHGLFSYFLMKGLEGNADGDGDRKITASELHA